RDRDGGTARPAPWRRVGKRGRGAFRAHERIADALRLCSPERVSDPICATFDARLCVGGERAWRRRPGRETFRTRNRLPLTSAKVMPEPTLRGSAMADPRLQ